MQDLDEHMPVEGCIEMCVGSGPDDELYWEGACIGGICE